MCHDRRNEGYKTWLTGVLYSQLCYISVYRRIGHGRRCLDCPYESKSVVCALGANILNSNTKVNQPNLRILGVRLPVSCLLMVE